jgi:ACS family tartrate transporter-like MFS transporter
MPRDLRFTLKRLSNEPQNEAALDRARRKAYRRLLPILFLCYVIAYVDRTNVSIAMLTMHLDLPAFNSEVVGWGAGLFFWGYFLLEVPAALMVEKWSARGVLSGIMIAWGIIAASTALVSTPVEFYAVRFLLGLAEAGFFPGVIVYLTHWFPSRDRARALACFLIATPVAQIVSPKISNALVKIGTSEAVGGVLLPHTAVMGLKGWQWLYVFWGIPAVLLGLVVLFGLTDRPCDARWLPTDERDALEKQLELERAQRAGKRRMKLVEAFQNPKVLLLAVAYFCSTSANYGVEFFLPTILKDWYGLKLDQITWLVILPPSLALASQLFVGWNSDRTKERRCHAAFSILIGLIALGLTPFTRGHLALTIGCFMVVAGGIKAYQPAFWALPSLFLTETAAAGSVGLINSIGNLGGYLGPTVLGAVNRRTGSFVGGIYFLVVSMAVCVTIILLLGVGRKEKAGDKG